MISENISSGNMTMNEEEFTRENIEKNKQIKLVDSDVEAGLDLFSYIHCESTDSELLKRCRGVVFKGDQVVMKGFPYTYELNEEDFKKVQDNFRKIDSEHTKFSIDISDLEHVFINKEKQVFFEEPVKIPKKTLKQKLLSWFVSGKSSVK